MSNHENWQPNAGQYSTSRRSLYSGPEWIEFRREILERDEFQCRRCKRRLGPRVVLHVHHKRYISESFPWEYAPSDCETLCSRCHAVEHKKIAPFSGWVYVDDEDLEDLCGACEYCGTEIRYVFHIAHANWFSLEVGTDCCDNLTEREVAPNGKESMVRYAARRERSVQRWTRSDAGWILKKKRFEADVRTPVDGAFCLSINGRTGKRRFPNPLEAKRFVFEMQENGTLAEYLKRARRVGLKGAT